MRRFLRDNGLTLVLLAIFLVTLIGQAVTGWLVWRGEMARHGAALPGFLAYLSGAHFLSSLFENWESEFLQMSGYVMLTAVLYQRGSAESKDPDRPAAVDAPPDPQAPPLLRKGAALRWLYAHSLGLALASLFVFSFIGHWLASAETAGIQAALHGEAAKTRFEYLGQPELWFESFQNWQSEFFSTAALVVMSIFLRQQGSPESKPVNAPHSQTGEG